MIFTIIGVSFASQWDEGNGTIGEVFRTSVVKIIGIIMKKIIGKIASDYFAWKGIPML